MTTDNTNIASGTANVAVGSIVMWAGSASAPTGWLICDGKNYAQAQYPNLFAAIGSTYTPSGTSSTDFCVPDLRGLFVRGVDDVGINDPDYHSRMSPAGTGAASSGVGSIQHDEFKSHTHTYEKFPHGRGNIASGRYWTYGHGTTSAVGGSETRPKNMYLYYIIKAQ